MSKKNEFSYNKDDKFQFSYLDKEIQSEIKDKVLSKLLTTVQSQAKEIVLLKAENTNLKDHLSYLLKRMILNKNEYVGKPNIIVNKKSFIKINNIKNNSAFFRDNNIKSNGSMIKPLKSVEKYRCATEANVFDLTSSTRRNKIINDENYVYQQNNNLMDSKVNLCLNNIYKNNFISNGISSSYCLNKKQSLFDEFFKNKKNNNTINYYGENLVEESLKKNSLKNKTNSNTKIRSNRRIDSRNLMEKNVNKTTYERASVKVEPKINSNKKNNFKSKKFGLYSNKNNGKTYEKIKPKRVIIFPKRSPFLANKF